VNDPAPAAWELRRSARWRTCRSTCDRAHRLLVSRWIWRGVPQRGWTLCSRTTRPALKHLSVRCCAPGR
jgi:hypothetical protein